MVHLTILEAKDSLTSGDLLTVHCLLKKVEALDIEFKENHYAVIDLVEDDEQILNEQQAVIDNHEDKVAEITECLQQLRLESKAASAAAHSRGHTHHLCRWLNDME